MSETKSETTKSDEKMTKIDAAIAAVNARKAMKAGNTGATTAKADTAPKSGRVKLTDADRKARQEKLEADRAERKAKKDAERQAKLAERAASRKPAHMSKVLKAGEKLPVLGDDATQYLNDATSNLSQAQLAALALHIQHFNRVKATERALTAKIEEGMEVTIVGGDPRFIGRSGTVTKAQRIRCYVEVDGFDKPCYCFTSDVEPAAAEVQATGTDG